MGEHSATHLGAPSHYGYSTSIDGFDNSLMVGKALFIHCEQYAQQSIGASEIEKCLANANPALGAAVNKGIQLVVIATGWAVHWGSESYFWGENPTSENHLLPAGLDISAIHFIFDKLHAQIIGIDGPNIDYGGAALANMQCGREIARRGAFHLENVALVPTDLPSLVDYILMPLRITGGTGAPARLIVGEGLFEYYAKGCRV
jgi:kynurenine formamidase